MLLQIRLVYQREFNARMNKLKKSRSFSYAVICLIYIAAAVAGIVIVNLVKGPYWVRMLIAYIAAALVAFICSLVLKNPSVSLPYRTFIPIITVFVLISSYSINFLKILLIIAICGWGVMLTYTYSLKYKNLKHIDWKHKCLMKAFGSSFWIVSLVVIYIIPAVITYTSMLPAAGAFTSDSSFSPFSLIFFFAAVGAIVMERYADYHMNLFQMDLADGYVRGCCRYGLWGNSRHPNYFAEIVFWWAIYFMILCSVPSKWYLFFGPLINTLVFVFIRIPLAEMRLSRKADFKKYKKSTYLLLPIPKIGGKSRHN